MVVTGFYLLSLGMSFSPFYILRRSDERKRLIRNYVLGFLTWLIYLLALSNTGVLSDFSLPPRVPLLIIIPSIIISVFFSGSSLFKEAMARVPVTFVVYIQTFRILVEGLIYGAFLNGVFPKSVTFEGTNFDILVGVSALLVGFLGQRNILGRKGLLIWNILSVCILILTGYSFISTYYFSDLADTFQALQFVQVPYLLLPGVLLPVAIFYHTVSIRQLMSKN
ncbi:hypothetical protein JMN32_23955 [Fulvivirga sp. 29W222]|uniref:Uncharacterized protein n=1 Tax=Fulvivirga marina TaxID=2494733 RepID=A0A937KE59_9BACT|nr:hypothetical protein [Fulvivirga marina]MBL6449387.1 hypothetical protein [Fulvivirga marina]